MGTYLETKCQHKALYSNTLIDVFFSYGVWIKTVQYFD